MMKFNSIPVVIAYLMSTSVAIAQSVKDVPSARSVVKESAELTGALRLKFGLNMQSADANLTESSEINDQFGIKFQVLGQQKNPFGDGSATKISFQVQSLNSKNDLLMAVPEAFLTVNEFSFGRKKSSLSRADQILNLGIINPTLTADQIQFEQQGLTGLHFEKKWQTFSVSMTALGGYLPSQAPGVREQDGALVGVNRWASTPPEKLRFNNEIKEINYKVTDVDYASILNHQGVLAGIGWQFEQSLVKIGVGRLPMNDIVISREIFADLEIRPQVYLTPVVIDQDVFSTEFIFETGPVLTTISLLQSQPNNKPASPKFETQKIAASTTYALMAEYPLRQRSSFLNSVSLAVAETRGGEIEDIDDSGAPAEFILQPQRFKFNKPVQLMAKLNLWDGRSQKITSDIKWVYDREQKGSLLDADVNFGLASGLSVNGGFTVIGVGEDNDDDKRFLFRMQANDRIYGGLNYVY
jgi:hypothetical protein